MQLRKILLADDDAEDRSIIQDAMELLNAGDVMQFADNGEEVLNFLEKNSGDLLSLCLIVLDLNMPKKNGQEVLQEIRETEKLKLIPGVVENGVFAKRRADVVIVGKDEGVQIIKQP